MQRKTARITPAYAGKRWTAERHRHPVRDHPRLCGEKRHENHELVKFVGSPPPMRGKGGECGVFVGCTRITPAYAGKSHCQIVAIFRIGDHPRLCGEKLKTAVKDGVYTGSPPPMRGKERAWTTCSEATRITPAYAGKRKDGVKSDRN